MFMLASNASTEALKRAFQHSGETIHRKINEVFDIVPELTPRFVNLPNVNQPHVKIASNPWFMPSSRNTLTSLMGHISLLLS